MIPLLACYLWHCDISRCEVFSNQLNHVHIQQPTRNRLWWQFGGEPLQNICVSGNEEDFAQQWLPLSLGRTFKGATTVKVWPQLLQPKRCQLAFTTTVNQWSQNIHDTENLSIRFGQAHLDQAEAPMAYVPRAATVLEETWQLSLL